MRMLIAALVLAALPSIAAADELTLRNGSTFTGSVREQGDKVTIQTEFGSMTFKKIDVKSVTKGRDLVSVLEEKLRAAASVKDLLDAAAWARDNGLSTRSNEVYEKVIARDPDNADARKALGYEKAGGGWLRGDELMAARGLVKVDGRWIGKDSADRILSQKAEERINLDRLQLEERIAAQRHEQEMAKLALERERIEIERKAAEQQAAYARELLLRDYDDRQWRPARGVSRWYFGNAWGDDDSSTAPSPSPAPRPAPRAATPQSRDTSPVPLTSPTVVPLTPPSIVPHGKDDDEKKR